MVGVILGFVGAAKELLLRFGNDNDNDTVLSAETKEQLQQLESVFESVSKQMPGTVLVDLIQCSVH